jgi:AcrR family transcriptional regulator
VSLGGQLHHFPTKDALVIAVLTQLSDRVLDIAAADAARDAEGLELLDLIAESAARFYATPEFLVYLDIFLSVRRHTLIGDTASALLASQRAAIESLWLPHLTFRGVDERTATMIVRGLWALARGLAISSVREAGPGDSGPTVSFVIEGMRRLVSLDAGTSRSEGH